VRRNALDAASATARKQRLMTRYHIQAWGSSLHPDLDEDFEEYPKNAISNYPFLLITRLDIFGLYSLVDQLQPTPDASE
jgi:hypothetical protein